MNCFRWRTVQANAAQKRRKPPTFQFITVVLKHYLRGLRKLPTATNQKVGGSNPFWRTTFSCGKQAISSEIACFFIFQGFTIFAANRSANNLTFGRPSVILKNIFQMVMPKHLLYKKAPLSGSFFGGQIAALFMIVVDWQSALFQMTFIQDSELICAKQRGWSALSLGRAAPNNFAG